MSMQPTTKEKDGGHTFTVSNKAPFRLEKGTIVIPNSGCHITFNGTDECLVKVQDLQGHRVLHCFDLFRYFPVFSIPNEKYLHKSLANNEVDSSGYDQYGVPSWVTLGVEDEEDIAIAKKSPVKIFSYRV